MGIYSLEFKPLSVLTKLPDAQCIFGAFCYKYKEIYGNNDLEELLNVESTTPVFLISSMFFKNVLPLPLDFKPKRKIGLTLEETTKNKRFKKVKYISKSLYVEYVSNKEKFIDAYYENMQRNYKIIDNNILVNKNDDILDEKYLINDYRIRNSNPLINDKKLFRDEIIYCNEKLTFNVYVNIIDDKYREKVLNTFKEMNYVFFGGMKSIGYNLFTFINCAEEKQLSNLKSKMLISKGLVKSGLNYDTSCYTLSVVNNKFNLQGSKINRKQLIVFNEGSIINTNNREYIGELISDKQDNVLTYQYYLGMFI